MHNQSKAQTLREIEELMKQACDLIKQIDVEVRSSDGAQRRQLSDRARPLREQLKRLQADFRETAERVEREDLLGGAKLGSKDAASRGRLVEANEQAGRQTQMIRSALEIAQDTEQVAIDITSELGRNRETIANIRGHISETSGTYTTRLRATLRRWRRRTRYGTRTHCIDAKARSSTESHPLFCRRHPHLFHRNCYVFRL